LVPEPQHIRLAYNNVYFVAGSGGSVLIDTGPDYEGAFRVLRDQLAGAPAIAVATHGHSDHAGLGAAWQRAGVPVLMGADDHHLARVHGLADPAEFALLAQFVRTSGAPGEAAAEALAGLERRRAANLEPSSGPYPAAGRAPRWPTGLRFEPFEALAADAETALPAGLTIVPSPGHTPGNLVLVQEKEGWLFSGDQLLPEITPTPAIQGDPACPGKRFRSLPAFRDSLRALGKRSFSRCYPGHGEPFDDVGAVIQANLDAIDQRSERVLAALQAAGSASLYVLCEALYRRAVQRRFWQIAPTVLGHLDLLEAEGLALEREGVFRAAS
jgi:glyoxylase-like metal-dependent hydrolase (beta-lactamase superfamily II)